MRTTRWASAAWLCLAIPVGAQNSDALGAEFCARSTAGDIAGVRELISPALARDIDAAFAAAGLEPPPTLFQSYVNRVPACVARTYNVALIEVRRSAAGGGAPAWTEYLVVVPEVDGTTRVDDVLFATRRSDTLRARLKEIAGEP